MMTPIIFLLNLKVTENDIRTLNAHEINLYWIHSKGMIKCCGGSNFVYSVTICIGGSTWVDLLALYHWSNGFGLVLPFCDDTYFISIHIGLSNMITAALDSGLLMMLIPNGVEESRQYLNWIPYGFPTGKWRLGIEKAYTRCRQSFLYLPYLKWIHQHR